MKLKKGTPQFGLAVGGALVLLGVLIMVIGFWKTLLLCALFAVGYFIGTVDNKREFMKSTANKLIPDKEVKVIDLKSELKREQEMNQAAAETAKETRPEIKTPQVKMPEVKTPEFKMPEVKAPEITAPEVKAPEITAPEITMPEETAPEQSTEE